LWNWKPIRTQRAAACRAMRSFVRKFPQYALTGGKGRKGLLLYEPADRLGAIWASLYVERRRAVPCSEARAALAREGPIPDRCRPTD
jgi:hypothetical protein